MSLKKLFRTLLGIQFALGIALAILTFSLFQNQERLSKSQGVHFQSYLLADELRQSSDDLTRLARTYVATGNEKYEREYWAVLDIRNGKSPRPVDYNRIYWDFISGTGQKPRPDGAKISLRELMIKEGFTDAEIEKLTLSQQYSDELVKTEKIAMNAVKGLFDDGAGNFTVKKEPHRALAIELMNDDAYHKHKVNIMKPIDEFYAMFAERTSGDVAKYERRSIYLLQSLGVLIIVIMGMFGYSFVIIQRQITEREWAEEERRRNKDLTDRLAQEIAIIAEIGKVVGSTLDTEEIYERFAAEVRKLISFDRIAVNLHDLDQGIVSTVYASGEPIAGRQPGDAFPLKGSVSEVVIKTRAGMFSHPVSIEEMDKQFPSHSATVQAGMRSLLCVPLISRDKVIASLHFRSKKPNAYTEQDLRLAERIGEQIAGAIANAQLYAGRKKTELSLRVSEERFRALVEQAAVGVAEIEMSTGRFFTVNRRLCGMVGRTAEELLATTFQAITHPEDLHLHEEKAALLLAGDLDYYSLEKRYLRKDGGIVWVNITVSPLWKPGEKPGRNMIVVEDITERKLAEEALRKSQDRYRSLVENASDIVFRTDVNGHFMFINPAGLRITGYEEKEIIGRHFPTLIRQDMREEAIKFFGLQFAKGIPNTYSEYPVIMKDGREIWLGQNTQLIFQDGKVMAFQAVARDITERKRAEAYREMGREVLQILNEPGDLKDSIQRVLAALKRRTGFDAVGIRLQKGDDFPYFVQEGFSEDFLLTENTLIERAADGEVCRDKEGNVSLECTCGLVMSGKTDPANPLFTPGGSFWINDSFLLLDLPPDQEPRLHPRNQCVHHGYASLALVPIWNKNRIVGLVQLNDRRKGRLTLETVELMEGIASHIGEALMRKQAEKALQASNELFSLFMRHSPIYAYIKEVNPIQSIVLQASDNYRQMVGIPGPEMVGKTMTDLFPPEFAAKITADDWAVVYKGGVLKMDEELNGRSYTTIKFPITWEEKTLLAGYTIDITERKRIEEALLESEKRYRDLSIIDDLSQLYNSRHFYHQLKIELDRSNRYKQALTLLLLDLDNFKAFNDAYGHVEGDQVILRLGQVVKRCLRQTDSAYRYGGEEFTILLPMATSTDGTVTAERIRTEFKKEIFRPVPGQDVHVTLSIGLGEYKPQEEMMAFVHRVDQLMYQGKKNGKDRVCSCLANNA